MIFSRICGTRNVDNQLHGVLDHRHDFLHGLRREESQNQLHDDLDRLHEFLETIGQVK